MLALHAMGFAVGCVAPIAIGSIRDLSDGMCAAGWALVFLQIAGIARRT